MKIKLAMIAATTALIGGTSLAQQNQQPQQNQPFQQSQPFQQKQNTKSRCDYQACFDACLKIGGTTASAHMDRHCGLSCQKRCGPIQQ